MSENGAQPLVYVFTPVYNGETYLRECIESVLNQTYSNWVYTIVNNCSTDRTLAIALEYALKDSRIRVHDNSAFLPAVENFNNAFALTAPDCKYCKPLSADERLAPHCLTKMVEVAETHPSVGLVCSYSSDGTHVMWQGPPHAKDFMLGRDICRATLLDERPLDSSRHVFGGSTTQLIRADLILKRRPFYNVSHQHSDFESCFDILQESDFGFVHDVLSFDRALDSRISAQIAPLRSGMVANLLVSIKFGSVYLTKEEHACNLEREFDEYYRVLAKHLLSGREPQFWEFHRRQLQNLGYSLDEERLTSAAAKLQQWQSRVNRAMQQVTTIIRDGDSFILVDDDSCHVDEVIGLRRAIPFLERDGEYFGAPDDDATAVRELERLRQSGASHIVFAWPAFWWLDHYADFKRYLDAHFSCVLKNDDVVVFNLLTGRP